MTTFENPPPQSRRSARQNERGEQQSQTTQFSQFTGEQPFAQQPSAPEPAPASQESSPVSGRRARSTSPEQYEAGPEPLNYTTQGRQPESYESQLPAAGYAPAPQEPAPFRVRDFSPEGGRRAASPPPLIEPQQQVYPAGASDLDYRTQAGPPAASPAPVAEPVAHQTLSRREMRQREMDADAAAGVPESLANPALLTQPPVLDSVLLTQPPVLEPVLLTQPPVLEPALLTQPPVLEPALLTQPPVLDSALLTQPPVLDSALLTQPPQLRTAPPPTMAPAPAAAAPAAAPQADPVQLDAAPPPVGPPSTVTSPPTALSNAMAEFESLTRTGQLPAPNAAQRVADAPAFTEPELEQTGAWVAPVGHWSRQADLDDETQPWENTITREVGGGNVATTTSALVLPEIPRSSNFSTALDSTGEVLLTGSIDLPPSLSTGGGDSRRYDDPNVDLMFDTQDAEFTGTDSSPVRAISAVSTHTSSRGVIHANKPHGNRMIVVVFIATAVLAVGVVGMLVASLALNLF